MAGSCLGANAEYWTGRLAGLFPVMPREFSALLVMSLRKKMRLNGTVQKESAAVTKLVQQASTPLSSTEGDGLAAESVSPEVRNVMDEYVRRRSMSHIQGPFSFKTVLRIVHEREKGARFPSLHRLAFARTEKSLV